MCPIICPENCITVYRVEAKFDFQENYEGVFQDSNGLSKFAGWLNVPTCNECRSNIYGYQNFWFTCLGFEKFIDNCWEHFLESKKQYRFIKRFVTEEELEESFYIDEHQITMHMFTN